MHEVVTDRDGGDAGAVPAAAFRFGTRSQPVARQSWPDLAAPGKFMDVDGRSSIASFLADAAKATAKRYGQPVPPCAAAVENDFWGEWARAGDAADAAPKGRPPPPPRGG